MHLPGLDTGDQDGTCRGEENHCEESCWEKGRHHKGPPSLEQTKRSHCGTAIRKPYWRALSVVEDRNSTRRFRAARSNGPGSSLSCRDGGTVGAYYHSGEQGHVTICSPSGRRSAERCHVRYMLTAMRDVTEPRCWSATSASHAISARTTPHLFRLLIALPEGGSRLAETGMNRRGAACAGKHPLPVLAGASERSPDRRNTVFATRERLKTR